MYAQQRNQTRARSAKDFALPTESKMFQLKVHFADT